MVPHPPMIVPAVGKGSEAQIQATTRAYEQVADMVAQLQPETILISSPHTVMYSDYFHISPGAHASGSFAQFRAGEVSFEETYDRELVQEICSLAAARGFPAGIRGERERHLDHGVMVPLYFIRQKYRDFRLVRMGLSGLSLPMHYELGQMVREAAEHLGRSVVWVASGDLSHKLQAYGPYGFAEEGPQYDQRIMDVCGSGDFGELLEFDENFCEKAAECGHRSFVMMAGAFDGMAVQARALSHEDITGVGYGICTFFPDGPDPQRHFLDQYLQKEQSQIRKKREKEDAYVRLARLSLETYIGADGLKSSSGRSAAGRNIAIPDWVPPEMKSRRAGVFVSLHEHGRLRGCIGTIQPVTGCIAEEIIRNAVSASTQDPRFDPVAPQELQWLEVHVDVLGNPEKIAGPEELDVRRYGVIVTNGRRRGLLLPDLEGVDSVAQQIQIARRKACIREDEDVELERFEVVRHG